MDEPCQEATCCDDGACEICVCCDRGHCSNELVPEDCTDAPDCPAEWHHHDCSEDNGACDRPELHVIAAG